MEQGKYILALDQGTTSSRSILFDRTGRIVSLAQREFAQYYPQPGWVEHNPREIWSSQLAVAIEAMANVGARATDVAAIGITNQRETTIVWDRATGEPIGNAIVWQCRRTADRIEALKQAGWTDRIREKTGLVPDAYFSATKLEWLLDHVEGARERAARGELAFGTVDSWLIWNLTGGKRHITDVTNAARTMLFDVHRCVWDEELLAEFHIPESILPEVVSSSELYGCTDASVLGGEIPIAGAAGDQQAALFGQCCFERGQVKNTYGTGGFLLMNTGDEAVTSQHGLITTIAASAGGKRQYALEGSVFVAGAAIQWLRDEMREVKSAAQSEEYADEVFDSAGVYLVPAFTGLGAPYWNPYARGTLVGLTRGCRKEHFIRATLESLAYQSADVIRAMAEDAGTALTELRVDGGASANNHLLQFTSDIVDATVYRPKCIETTALGAAYLAGLAVGYWKDLEDVRTSWQLGRTFTPRMAAEERESLLFGWRRAVHTALAYAEYQEQRG
ncbi:MAG: glycerol kinase GlpK [Butyrivibrio sp.]|nr:glycerol kinase GlpK [Butyrivibrio sp.]